MALPKKAYRVGKNKTVRLASPETAKKMDGQGIAMTEVKDKETLKSLGLLEHKHKDA